MKNFTIGVYYQCHCDRDSWPIPKQYNVQASTVEEALDKVSDYIAEDEKSYEDLDLTKEEYKKLSITKFTSSTSDMADEEGFVIFQITETLNL